MARSQIGRQTSTLVRKNLRLALLRKKSALWIVIALPIILASLFSFARNLFAPPAKFGIGTPHEIRSFSTALSETADTGRRKVLFVNNGHDGGAIEAVIDRLEETVKSVGHEPIRLSDPAEVGNNCPSSLRGVTQCFVAITFHSSPQEGSAGIWNYTMKFDGALGATRINVDRDDNDAQRYLYPVQYAIDQAIVAVTQEDGDSGIDNVASLPPSVSALMYTSMTKREREDAIRRIFQKQLISWMAVTFFSTIMYVAYHLAGFVSSERESGMIRLLDAMMPVQRWWHGIFIRTSSYMISFTLLYSPGWIISALIIKNGLFRHTSVGIVLIFQILAGLSVTSFAMFASSLYKKAQMSGNLTLLAMMLLAIMAQSITNPSTAVVGILSFLFPPCNYVYFLIFIARFEETEVGANLGKEAPKTHADFALPGYAFWIFALIHILVYPVIAALIESIFHGTHSPSRNVVYQRNLAKHPELQEASVILRGFSKLYAPTALRKLFSFVSKPRPTVLAVNDLSLSAGRGQIIALLGANGSGKSTTLDAIAGLNKITGGEITIDGSGGIGIAPQKNVLWDLLTVEEHLRIFNRLKSPDQVATKEEIRELIKAVDLEHKAKAFSSTLSGGQKRKLQLGMMLTGGSAVCCVDEVSSGIDPLSRRKIWDILLAERGRRTIIMTTHFLDEADLLADHIALLSKGVLRAEGPSAQLKETMGGGYRVRVPITPQQTIHNLPPALPDVQRTIAFETATYQSTSSSQVSQVVRQLEQRGFTDYRLSSPTIEDVFLRLAEEIQAESTGNHAPLNSAEDSGSEKGLTTKSTLDLARGRPLSYWEQTVILFRKRLTVLKHNWIPYLVAFCLPILGAALTQLFLRDRSLPGCTPAAVQSAPSALQDFREENFHFHLVAGPDVQSVQTRLDTLVRPALDLLTGSRVSDDLWSSNVTYVNSVSGLTDFVDDRYRDLNPGGFFLGGDNLDQPEVTFAFRGNGFLMYAMIMMNMVDSVISNVPIIANYDSFSLPWDSGMSDTFQLITYMALALCAFPGFLALYPNVERRTNIRGLEFSNGVRALPLWIAYTFLDFVLMLVSLGISAGIWIGVSDIWFKFGYVFLLLVLFALASIILSYMIGLWTKTQLSTYAIVAFYQAVFYLVYVIGYTTTLTYAPVTDMEKSLNILHFVISIFAPIVSMARGLFISLNMFSTACDTDAKTLTTNAGGILYYGGPILYLIVQIVVYFALLVALDSGVAKAWWTTKRSAKRAKDKPVDATGDHGDRDIELTHDVSTAGRGDDGLEVQNLVKSFDKNTVVDNVSFNIQRDEVFALLGPNGAGKSTTISLIRGDIKPDHRGGDVLVEKHSISRNITTARSHLGVCPQHDAIDHMTVREHLTFYARVRGVKNVAENVQIILQAVGLWAFADRMAGTLSGGNKRKLSLGIALMGNPTVVLLDEPSSGLDAAAKRIMWKTLQATIHGRSLLLTTHSMEEADALAGRVGILAKRMLAIGTIDELRHRFGDVLHVHLVCRSAPRTTPEEMETIRAWIAKVLPGAQVEDQTYHGQMRFTVAPQVVFQATEAYLDTTTGYGSSGQNSFEDQTSKSAIGRLHVLLDENRRQLGIEHFSVSPTSLDEVFLTIVGQHNIQEENSEAPKPKKRRWWKLFKR